MKKGQITIFIILGIMLLFITTLAIYLAAGNGGYINPKGEPKYGEKGDGSQTHYHLESYVLPYALNKTEKKLRPLPELLESIERYIAAELNNCLDFSALTQKGYTVSYPDIDWQEINFDFEKAGVPYSTEKVRINLI